MPQNTTGSVLAISDGMSPPTYTQITLVGDIADAMGHTTNMHRTDAHSPNAGWGSQIPGLKMLNDTTFQVFFEPSNAQHAFDVAGGLGGMARANPPTLGEFLFYYPGAAADAVLFNAYVGSCTAPAPVDGALMVEFTLNKTGAPTNVDASTLTVVLDT